jgi:hypothetical protein
MLVRSVLTSLGLALALGACATVSVIPGTSTVETGITQKQSNLRLAAVAFNEAAVNRGWINESLGFVDLARVLVDGKSSVQAESKTYASLIGADVRASEDIIATLLTDVSDSKDALSLVSTEADTFLTGRTAIDARTAREDLVSFERALVQAQRSRRAFIEAMSISGVDETSELTTAFEALDHELTRARDLADRMATEYSQRDTSISVS